MTEPVVTRFAPSPTGYLHIGGARTALFNRLYAKGRGGRFLLRIEDTDRERSTPEAVQAILDGLAWLGVTPDEPPVFQAARADRHREVAMQLLAQGRAYRDYASPEEGDAGREAARAEGRTYRSPWRDRRDQAPADGPFAVRFLGPLEGEVVTPDLVQGEVRWRAAELDDLVLLRSDGSPTYNLAVVVDDHDMGVTHVIRGDDHLNNAARQSLIYDALGWTRPAFAHVPLIHGPDGAKLSKRHGAQATAEYAELGYLAEGMRNYLARLGWSHGDQEIFSDAEAEAWFDIADVGRSPARLDFDKLDFVNGCWLRQADDARLAALTAEAFARAGEPLTEEALGRLQTAVPQVKDRAKTVIELVEQTRFATRDRPIPLDGKARLSLNDETQARLSRLRERLVAEAGWAAEPLEALLKEFAEAEGVGFGKFAPAARAILTGGAVAPDLHRTLAAIGRDESLARFEDALSGPA